MKRTVKPSIVTMMILVIALILSGCYWTPEGEEGAITLEIDAGALGASQLQDYNGFFFGYVVADDLLRGDQTAAEEAFTEVEAALDDAFSQNPESPEDFNIKIAFPSIQLQANLFKGTSGSNTFAGLRAGREYLVVVTAGTDATDGIGYTVTTVDAGENKTVRLDLGNKYAEFDQFLRQRYGIIQGDQGPVDVAVSLQAVGTLPTVPSPLYYDIVDVSSVDFSLDEYYATYLSLAYVSEFSSLNGPDLSVALSNLPLVNADGSAVPDSASGNRLQLPADNVITGLKSGMKVRILIVDETNRATTSPQAGTTAITLTDPFTVGYSTGTFTLPLYEWATGF